MPMWCNTGKQANGTQRYRCDNPDCLRVIFLLQYHDEGRLPAMKQQIIDMTLNGSAVRDIVVSCGSVQPRVVDVLKKKPTIKQVNERLLKSFDPAQLDISFGRLRPPRWMKCGALWAAKASRAGCGTPSNITQDSS
jgi:hypothetical protein